MIEAGATITAALALRAGLVVVDGAQRMRRAVERERGRRTAGIEPQAIAPRGIEEDLAVRRAPSASRTRMIIAPVSTLSGFMRRTNSAT